MVYGVGYEFEVWLHCPSEMDDVLLRKQGGIHPTIGTPTGPAWSPFRD